MTVIVNGSSVELERGSTVARVMTELGRDPTSSGAAVAVNGEILPQRRWAEATLDEGDRVEVVSAAQGGSV